MRMRAWSAGLSVAPRGMRPLWMSALIRASERTTEAWVVKPWQRLHWVSKKVCGQPLQVSGVHVPPVLELLPLVEVELPLPPLVEPEPLVPLLLPLVELEAALPCDRQAAQLPPTG